MSTAVSSWTCPQCQRRVPGREPLCHCGFARPAGRAGAARPLSPSGEGRQWRAFVPAGVACLLAGLVYMALRPGDLSLAAAGTGRRPQIQGPVGYPALPAVPTVKVRRAKRTGASTPNVGTPSAAVAPVMRPAPTASEQEWTRAKDLLDLPLRKIAADTSVLELSYRPFAEACVDRGDSRFVSSAPGDGHWLTSLKTAALRPGVTLRDKGATVDCETARRSLVARADALKADLAATETLARTNRVLPDHWRQLLARHELTAWDRD